ncbi:sensor histidine kinase [Flavobacterium sp.]|uniref:sensor histidine kinase n=1 Tax=Flavobacterium sp. TaxID=239 RepID=UPI003D1196C4
MKFNLKLFLPIIVLVLLVLFFFWERKQLIPPPSATIRFNQKYFDTISGTEKIKYLDSVVILLKGKKNDSILRDLYLKTGEEYYYLNSLKKSFASSVIALRLSQKENDSLRIAESLYYIGDCHTTKSDSAYFYYLQAQKIYAKIHDYDQLGRMYFYKACLLFYDGKFVECEVEITNALKYLKNSKSAKLLYSCNTLMGNCLEKLLMYDQALKYHHLALGNLKVLKRVGKDTDVVNNYNITSVINICNLYDVKGDFKRSVKELSPLISPELEKKWPALYAAVLSNLAYSKMKNKEYKNVESMFLKSLKIVDSLADTPNSIYKKIHLGEFYLTQKDTLHSLKFLKEAYDVSVKMKHTNQVLNTLKLLKIADSKKKMFYANRYIEVSDSINSLQSRTSNKYARIEYETASLEDQNKVLTKKNFYILIFSFALFLLLSAIFVLIYLKYKNKELKFVKQQQNDSDEIYQLLNEQQEKINAAKDDEKNKIAKELHDGVMNRIYGVRMNLGFFNSKVDEKTIEKRKEYIFELANIENEIRTISHDLSQDSFLESNDFNILVSNLIKDQKGVSKTVFHYTIEEEFNWDDIENIYKINFYRIIQEALLNIHKHSNAKKVEVKVQLIDNHVLRLSIIDDGIGLDINSVKKGIGLSNIKERTVSLKGHFEIKSRMGEGTEITATFVI